VPVTTEIRELRRIDSAGYMYDGQFSRSAAMITMPPRLPLLSVFT